MSSNSKYDTFESRDDVSTYNSHTEDTKPIPGWKSLLQACKDGTLTVVRQHLENGVDPNHQHPRVPTKPIFAAIRNGHWHILQVLLEKGASLHNEVEKSSGMTPMQVAIMERQHVIVDYLIERLHPDELQGLRTILISGHIGTNILVHLAGSGHCIYVDDAHTSAKTVLQIQRMTGNRKVYLTDMMVPDLNLVTHWLIRENSYQEGLLRYMREYVKVMTRVKRIVIMTESSKPSLEVSWLLQYNPYATAIVEPSSMWHRLGDSKWPEHWMDSIWWIVATRGAVEGRLYTYLRKPVTVKPEDHPRIWNTAYRPLALGSA